MANGPTRLFPSPRLTIPSSKPLSILDSTCARFGDTGAIWLFHAPSDRRVDDEFVAHLRSSFISTLNDFPQWAGQLHWAPFRSDGDHTERFNRGMITYGSGSDPGAEWNVIRHDFAVDSIVPTDSAASSSGGFWAGDSFPQSDLISPNRTALFNLKDFEGRPCLLVQINLFACGGYGIGIRIAHPLADAQSMMVFVHQWAANARGEFGAPKPSLFDGPVFDPSLLDLRAAGDIDAPSADESVVEAARSLPLHRFDWWETDAPGYSPHLVASTKNCIPPADILAKTTVSPSTTGPWSTWDLSRPASWGVLHFTGGDLTRLQRLAREDAPEDSGISRTDALLAYLFRLITRARSYTQSPEDEVSMSVTLDARRRVSPPLPETFIGSPLLLTHVKGSAASIRNARISDLALNLRQTMQLFTSDKMAAVLHDAAHEISPQRLWLGFVGTLHLIVSSWQRLRVYDVDFEGKGARPRYVHAVLQKSDGLLMLLDPLVSDGGVDVALYLDAEAMARFLEELRKTGVAPG
jgi:hypothetical protein